MGGSFVASSEGLQVFNDSRLIGELLLLEQ